MCFSKTSNTLKFINGSIESQTSSRQMFYTLRNRSCTAPQLTSQLILKINQLISRVSLIHLSIFDKVVLKMEIFFLVIQGFEFTIPTLLLLILKLWTGISQGSRPRQRVGISSRFSVDLQMKGMNLRNIHF